MRILVDRRKYAKGLMMNKKTSVEHAQVKKYAFVHK